MATRDSTSTRAIGALGLSLGTAGAFVAPLSLLSIPLAPAWYLGALGMAVALALVAVWRARRWLTVSAPAVCWAQLSDDVQIRPDAREVLRAVRRL